MFTHYFHDTHCTLAQLQQQLRRNSQTDLLTLYQLWNGMAEFLIEIDLLLQKQNRNKRNIRPLCGMFVESNLLKMRLVYF